MSLVFLIFTVCLPFFHLQFVKATLAKQKQEFRLWEPKTLEVMYMGAVSPILVALFLFLAEWIGVDVKMGELGYIFGIISSVLMYEMYIQKTD